MAYGNNLSAGRNPLAENNDCTYGTEGKHGNYSVGSVD